MESVKMQKDNQTISEHQDNIEYNMNLIIQKKFDVYFDEDCQMRLQDLDLFNYDQVFECITKVHTSRSVKKLSNDEMIKQIQIFLNKLSSSFNDMNIQIYHSVFSTIMNQYNCNQLCMYTNTNLQIVLQKIKDKATIRFYTQDGEIDFIMGYNAATSSLLCDYDANNDKYSACKSIDTYVKLINNKILNIINPHCYVDYLTIMDSQIINRILNTDFSEVRKDMNRLKAKNKLLSDKLIAKDKIIQNKVDEISAIKTKISYYLKHNTSLEYVTIVLLILLIGFLVCVYIDPNNLINGIICVHNRFHGIPMYDDNEF